MPPSLPRRSIWRSIRSTRSLLNGSAGKATYDVGENILKGVYRLEGKTLMYCLSAAGKPRPRGFSIAKGSGQALVKLQRFTTGKARTEAAPK